ncbi:alpha/beta hydrolase [Dictyobacter alpinus]|uniref:Alpha/beta hydrolase n=1 Tax=Dictyobacter alpinus TaxID=2014873 RepID=A0A402B974_9CHLR|nr:alpha/beta fold hydrolase [Dictyobacter alpinus]GCE27852.1 alpha/beta hydrolase [Dictyobacter alpinus]
MALKASINSVDLAYEDHGIGMPVLLLHAFPLNHSMWDEQITALLNEQRYRLVAPDFRGFGESGINNDISTMDLFADDLAALMDALGMQQAVLCGLSMGGYAAFAFYHKYPHRVGGLILADTQAGADNEEVRATREKVALMAVQQGPDAVADLQLPRLITASTRANMPEVETRIRQMILAAQPSGIAAAARGMATRADFTAMLDTITCPTLVIAGEHDLPTPPAVAQAYAQRIPGAQFAVIPGAGHLSNLERPDAFQQLITTFLRSNF